MKIIRYILGAICTLLAIIFLIAAIRLSSMIGAIPAEATGTVLTNEFIMSDCARHALTYQRAMLFVSSAILGITGICTILIKRLDKSILTSIFNWIFIISILTKCILAVLEPAPDAVSVLSYKPQIRQGSVTEMYQEQYSSGSVKYVLEFGSGNRLTVSSTEYYSAQPGKIYYLVYFGTELFEAYDPNTYSLPES